MQLCEVSVVDIRFVWGLGILHPHVCPILLPFQPIVQGQLVSQLTQQALRARSSLNNVHLAKEGGVPPIAQEPGCIERNSVGPLPCCLGSRAGIRVACRQIILGSKHVFPTQILTTRPPSYKAQKRDTRKDTLAGRLFSPEIPGITNKPEHAVTGIPEISQ